MRQYAIFRVKYLMRQYANAIFRVMYLMRQYAIFRVMYFSMKEMK